LRATHASADTFQQQALQMNSIDDKTGAPLGELV
jgi:hypothetical protein